MSLSLRDPVRQLQRDLSRLLRHAADRLVDDTAPLDARIHETRRKLKQARAWARLLPGMPDDELRAELRALHRALGVQRDDDVLRATLVRLQPMAEGAALAALPRLQRSLRSAAIPVAVHDIATRLRHAADALPDAAGSFDLLLDGIVRMARRSHRALRRARASGVAADFHRWRKHAKYLAFQLHYVEMLAPRDLRADAEAFARVAERLGEGHDLELVRAPVAQAGLPAEARAALLALVDREQRRCHDEAARLGAALHAESPRALGRRLAGYRAAQGGAE